MRGGNMSAPPHKIGGMNGYGAGRQIRIGPSECPLEVIIAASNAMRDDAVAIVDLDKEGFLITLFAKSNSNHSNNPPLQQKFSKELQRLLEVRKGEEENKELKKDAIRKALMPKSFLQIGKSSLDDVDLNDLKASLDEFEEGLSDNPLGIGGAWSGKRGQ